MKFYNKTGKIIVFIRGELSAKLQSDNKSGEWDEKTR